MGNKKNGKTKGNKAMKKTGKVIRKGKKFSLTEALPDSPIYNRGFVIGGMRTKDSSNNTPEKNSKDENKKPNSYSQDPDSVD